MRFSCLVIGWILGEGMVEGIGVLSRFIEDFMKFENIVGIWIY